MFIVVQENLIRGGLDYRYEQTRRNEQGDIVSRRQVQTSTRPVNAIDDDVRINRNLWDIAMTLERELA